MSDVTTIEADVLERYADAVAARLQKAVDEDVVSRIWRKDRTLWPLEGSPGLDEGSLGELASDLKPPDDFAIMGYLPYDPATEQAIDIEAIKESI
jgi:hypothetical protein